MISYLAHIAYLLPPIISLIKGPIDMHLIQMEKSPSKVVVGWGAHALVVGNSSLGTGSLLAANSLLNCHSKDYAIYGGIPAKLLKYNRK